MSNQKNILIVGVGGQGILTASRIIAKIALKKGFDVKTTEIHGMSQRGGSVYTMVRYGDKIFSPIIPALGSDFLLSFELMETFKWLTYCNKDTQIIVNNMKIPPPAVLQGKSEYPKGLLKNLKSNIINTISIDAISIADQLGSRKSLNMVILGAYAKFSEFAYDEWVDSISKNTPARFLELNLEAFERGFNNQDNIR